MAPCRNVSAKTFPVPRAGWRDERTDRSTFGLVTCYIFNVRGHLGSIAAVVTMAVTLAALGVLNFSFEYLR